MKLKREELEKILQNIHEMQKFIESKNAILITLVLALLTIAREVFNFNLENTWEYIPFFSMLVSLLISVISFIPITSYNSINNKDNAYFFGSISKLSLDEYKNLVTSKNDEDLNDDLYKQIVINSRIVNRKIKLFKLSIRTLSIIGLLLYVCEFISSRD